MKARMLAATIAAICAGLSATAVHGGDGPQTGDPLLNYKLRASRAETEQREIQHDAEELEELSAGIAKRVAARGALGAEDGKAIERIRKLARRSRSRMGGLGDPEMADPPRSLAAIAAALGERGAAFAEQVRCSTRFEVNARLVGLAGELVYLSDALKRIRE
jgi:hypothetical protein